MRCTRVTAMAGALVVLLLSPASGGGTRAEIGPDEAETRGAAQVEKSCVGCHPGVQLEAVVQHHVAGRDASVALDVLLAEHHAPDAAVRADVIVHLRARLDEAVGAK